MQPPLPASLIRAQVFDAYRPVVAEDGWERWNQQAHWVLELDEETPLLCQLRPGQRPRAPFTWRPGTWHLYAPDTGYRICYPRPVRAHPNRWVIFALHTPVAGLRRRCFGVFEDQTGRLAALVDGLARRQGSEAPGDRLQATGLLLELVGCLANAALDGTGGTPEQPWVVSDGTGDGETAPTLLQRLDAVLGTNLQDPPAVAEVATRLGMSPSSLAHRLRAETGWTVVARTRALRIQEAQRLLLANPTTPLKALASRLGFSSPQYLIRVFRETTGLSPRRFEAMSAYRRPRAEGDEGP